MAGNYKQLKAQIAKLQEEAAAVRNAEAANAVAEIKSLMAEFDLTAEDLGFKTGRRAAVKGKGVAKYRDPETGKTWTGRGKPPAWMAAAAKAGKADALLIEKAAPAAPAAPAPKRSRSARPSKKAAAPVVAEAAEVKKKATRPAAKKAPAKAAPEKAAAKPKAPRRAPKKKAAEAAPAEAAPAAESVA